MLVWSTEFQICWSESRFVKQTLTYHDRVSTCVLMFHLGGFVNMRFDIAQRHILHGGYTIREKPPKWNTEVLVETRSWYVKFCFKIICFETKLGISWPGFNMHFSVPFGRFFVNSVTNMHNIIVMQLWHGGAKPPKWNPKVHVETQSWYVMFGFKNICFAHV